MNFVVCSLVLMQAPVLIPVLSCQILTTTLIILCAYKHHFPLINVYRDFTSNNMIQISTDNWSVYKVEQRKAWMCVTFRKSDRSGLQCWPTRQHVASSIIPLQQSTSKQSSFTKHKTSTHITVKDLQPLGKSPTLYITGHFGDKHRQ